METVEGTPVRAPLVKHKYKCPVCGEAVTVYVNPSQPPSHPCKLSANKVVEFVKIK